MEHVCRDHIEEFLNSLKSEGYFKDFHSIDPNVDDPNIVEILFRGMENAPDYMINYRVVPNNIINEEPQKGKVIFSDIDPFGEEFWEE